MDKLLLFLQKISRTKKEVGVNDREESNGGPLKGRQKNKDQ